jgi:predicted amidohydrolase
MPKTHSVSISRIAKTIPGISGKIEVVQLFLSQAMHPRQQSARGLGLGLPAFDSNIVDSIPNNTHIAVLSEHPAFGEPDKKALLQSRANERNQIIIAPIGPIQLNDKCQSAVQIFVPNDESIDQYKLSFSAQELVEEQAGRLTRGTQLSVIETPYGVLSVISCHDYTHPEIINALSREKIDILIVTTNNPSTGIYEQYARADLHRLNCFIVVSNVANFGGSAVYAPFTLITKGSTRVPIDGVLFSTKGPGNANTAIELPVGDLARTRQLYRERDLTEEVRFDERDVRSIVPPEDFLKLPDGKMQPHYSEVISKPDCVEITDLDSQGYVRRNRGHLRVGVAQLRSPSFGAYLDSSYHVSLVSEGLSFGSRVSSWLDMFESLLVNDATTRPLDFLVFPEVFVPLPLLERLKVFSNRWSTIVIAGIEYEPQEDPGYYGTSRAKGNNRCIVLIPTKEGVKRVEYIKLTRSQYDARTRSFPDDAFKGTFQMYPSGQNLRRFVSKDLGSFGVLICYDLSHFQLLHALNTSSNLLPVDVVYVVAHNPFSELYRNCCLADCHRYYQYIIMCNVAQYGGSGVFGPIRTKGEGRVVMDVGKNCEGIFSADIDISALAKARVTEDIHLTDKPPRSVMCHINGETASFHRRSGFFQCRLNIVGRNRADEKT